MNRAKSSLLHSVIDYGKTIVISFIIILLLSQFVVSSVQVVGKSMYPTLVPGQWGLASIFKVNLELVDRFDVVVVKNTKHLLVKRIIGLPNETIQYKDNILYIDGEEVKEAFLDEAYCEQFDVFTDDFGPFTLGEEEYFCLGDNRPVSIDSRYYGAFSKDELYGVIDLMVYPFKVVE